MSTKTKMPRALLALTLSSFAIGVTEFIPLGLLAEMSNYFSTSLSSMGMVVSMYAIGVAIGAPILTNLISSLSRKNQLIFTLVLFTLGNLLAAVSTSFNMLILARVISGLSHGVFFTIGSIIASEVSAPEKRSQAIAIMFAGLTVALVIGVPLGTFLGKTFSWNFSFYLVTILGAIATFLSYILTPKTLKKSEKGSIADQFSVLKEERLIKSYLLTIIGYGGSFVLLTYLAEVLKNVSGFGSNAISVLLLIYGVAVAIGNIYGGKISDKMGAMNSLKLLFFIQVIAFGAFYFTAKSPILAVINVFALGLLDFAIVPPLQMNVVEVASEVAPKATDSAAGLNIAAFNLGIAGASTIGGVVVSTVGVEHTPWVAASILSIAFLMSAYEVAKNKKVAQLCR
ncbi:MAG: MFS transporter [Cetobacterium sp.]|uniref:MFS transporter n=1 Tax=uncultured Cetobacterium sp. TaxID=527638 RepID=UPI0025DC674A|nr:MFS transporter [uncultured Cetobacterium sp.]